MDEFDIYIRGFRAGGPERPELALRRVFGLDEEQAREFVGSLPRVVKRRVPAPDRGRYAKVLGEMGAELEFRRSPIQPIQAVAVKGVAAGQGAAPQPRQPGHVLTLGDLLAEPAPGAARPAPVWPAPAEPVHAPEPEPRPAAAPAPAPAPVASVQPAAVSAQAQTHHDPAQAPYELGMAHTHRVESSSALPRLSGGEPPRQLAPATMAEPRRSWTVANTPAVGASTGEAFAANPVKGPATATLRQQPAFGAVAGPAAAPAASVPEVAPAARPARPQANAPTAQVDAAHAYSQASTSDSMKLDPVEAPKQPSWLVQESSLRQQAPSPAPATSALAGLELGEEPAYGKARGSRGADSADMPDAATGGEAYEDDSAGRWLLSLGGEGGAARGGPRPATSVRAAPQPATSIRAAAPQQGATSIRAAAQQGATSIRAAPPGAMPIANLPSGAPAARIESGRGVRAAGIADRPQRRTLSRSLGIEGRSLPFGIRLLLRVGLGVSAFLLLLTLRSCPLLTTDLQKELAHFEHPAGEPGAEAASELSLVQGEKAHEWLEAGDHQFRDPSTGALLVDKDPVRGLVSRLHRLGAPEVYVYGVQRVELIVYAEGIDVVLPDDPSQRGAIFLEESRFHRLDAPSVADTGQPRLRIPVP